MKLNLMRHKRHRHSQSSGSREEFGFSSASYDAYSLRTGENQLTSKEPIVIMKSKAKYLSKINPEGELEHETHEEEKEPIQKKKFSFLELNYAGVGYTLVTPIVIGVVLGVALDRTFRQENHFYSLVFIIAGFLSSLYNLFKLTKK